MKWLKQNIWIVLPIMVVVIGFLPIVIFNNGVLIFGGDSYHQMYQFYQGGWQLIKDGNLTSFLFSLGLGTNVMAMVYYLASPFFLFTLLLTNKDLIQYTFLYLNQIKIVLLFIFTFLWARKISKHFTSQLIAAFIIAFGGWTFSYLHLNMFLDAFLFYPLVLYFIERYLNDQKILGLVLCMGVIGIINYYFLYMLLPFSCLYALIRYIEIKKPEVVKQTVIAALKFVGLCLLGVGLACVVIIPVAYMLKSNPRFSEYNFGLLDHIGKSELYKIISSLFVPVLNHEDTNLFINLNNYSFIGWGGGASLYSFMISILLLPGVFLLSNKARKKGIISVFALLIVMLLFKNFWLLLQFNMESRWFYMFSFMIAFSVISVNDEIIEKHIDKKKVLIGFTIAILGLWGFFAVSYFAGLNDISYLKNNIYIIVVLTLLSVGYLIYYLKWQKQLLLIALLVVESIFSITQLISHENIIDYHVTQTDATYNQDIINYLKEDTGFYRVLVNEEYYTFPDGSYTRYTTSNTPFASDINGVSFYSTIYNSQQEPYLSRLKNNWQMDQRYSSWRLYNLLSTKYLYDYSYVKELPFGYQQVKAGDNWHLYQNKYYVELGFAYDKTITKDAFDHLTYLEQDMCMSDYLVTSDATNTTIESPLIFLEDIGSDDIRYSSQYETTISNASLYFDIGSMQNVRIELFNNDTSVYAQEFTQYNYVDIYIPPTMEVNKIIVYGNNDGEHQDVKVYKEDLSNYDDYFNERFKESFFNVDYNNSKIEADISITGQAKWIYTSIAYDSGWQVYVDGKEVDTEMVQLGFVGFKCPEGNHHVEFKYHIPYFGEGLIVSLASLALLVLICLRGKYGKEKVN